MCDAPTISTAWRTASIAAPWKSTENAACGSSIRTPHGPARGLAKRLNAVSEPGSQSIIRMAEVDGEAHPPRHDGGRARKGLEGADW